MYCLITRREGQEIKTGNCTNRTFFSRVHCSLHISGSVYITAPFLVQLYILYFTLHSGDPVQTAAWDAFLVLWWDYSQVTVHDCRNLTNVLSGSRNRTCWSSRMSLRPSWTWLKTFSKINYMNHAVNKPLSRSYPQWLPSHWLHHFKVHSTFCLTPPLPLVATGVCLLVPGSETTPPLCRVPLG